MTDQAPMVEESDGGVRIRLIAAALVVAALGLFVFQNTQRVEVNFAMFDGTIPLFLLLLIATASGVILAVLGGWYLRRRNG